MGLVKQAENTLSLRRDDFVILSDGSSIFDHVLGILGINAEFQPQIYEVSINFDHNPSYKIWNESGKRLSTTMKEDGEQGLTEIEESLSDES